jgi:hypothetical protein
MSQQLFDPMAEIRKTLQGTGAFQPIDTTNAEAGLNNYVNSLNFTNLPTASNGSFVQPDFWSWDAFTGYMNEDTGQKVNGWAGTAFDTFKDVAGLGLAFANYNRAGRQMRFNEAATKLNANNQAKMLNAQMEGMAKARYALDPTAYESPSEYMKKNAVSGWGG